VRPDRVMVSGLMSETAGNLDKAQRQYGRRM
jgi:hypothetical protein